MADRSVQLRFTSSEGKQTSDVENITQFPGYEITRRKETQMTYVGTVYWFDDETGFRHRKTIQTEKLDDILKVAMIKRLSNSLAGYKIVTTEGVEEEWWDRKARAKWARGKRP